MKVTHFSALGKSHKFSHVANVDPFSRAWQKIIVCRRLPNLTHFLVLRKVYSFTNAWQKLLNFPPVAKVIRSPVLSKSNSCSRHFTHVPTRDRRWPFFPCLVKVTRFPALCKGYSFSRAWYTWPFTRVWQRFLIFPPLLVLLRLEKFIHFLFHCKGYLFYGAWI